MLKYPSCKKCLKKDVCKLCSPGFPTSEGYFNDIIRKAQENNPLFVKIEVECRAFIEKDGEGGSR